MPHHQRSSRLTPAALVLTPLLALATALGGCTSAEARREAAAAESRDLAASRNAAMFELGYRNKWRSNPVEIGGASVEHLVPFEDVVLVLDSDSRLTALDTETGRIRWSIELTDALTRFVGLTRVGDRAVASTQTEVFVVRISQGALEDRQRLNRIAVAAPTMVGAVAVFGTANGELLAHRVERGVPSWGNLVGSTMSQSPVASGNIVAAAADDGNVLFVDATTGQRTGLIRIFGPPSHAPIAGGDLFYLSSFDQSFYAFTPVRGDVVWRVRSGSPVTGKPVYDRGVVYVELPERGMSAFEGESGLELWSSPDVRGTAAASNDRGLVIWSTPTATLVDPQRGDVILETEVTETERFVPDIFHGGSVYTLSSDGSVSRYEPRF